MSPIAAIVGAAVVAVKAAQVHALATKKSGVPYVKLVAVGRT